MGYDEHGQLYVASEMKALVPVCRTIKEFPAGSYLWSQDGEIRSYYHRDWFDYDAVKDNVTDKNELRQALEDSVKSHLMSDVLTVCCFLVVWIPQLFPLSPRNTQPVAWKIRNALKPGGRSYTPLL
ncbi:asparagine synthetase B [Escherichia coli]|nr:asparagine synthetase B [Escherichia coli]